MSRKFIYLLLCIFLPLSACADIEYTPENLTPLTGTASEFVVSQRLIVQNMSKWASAIPQNSRWKEVGLIPQGHVYKIVNDVFATTAGASHEAAIVVANGSVVGFYLLYEHAYAGALQPVSLETHIP